MPTPPKDQYNQRFVQKLTDQQVMQIRCKYVAGRRRWGDDRVTCKSLAEEYGVSEGLVSAICRNRARTNAYQVSPDGPV
jgi:hypothetical protein